MNKKILSKYKFILIAPVCFIIPYLEFVNFNSESLDPILLRTLNYTTVLLIFFTFLFSFFLSFLFKKKTFDIFFLFSLLIFVFFNYDKFKFIVNFLLKNTEHRFIGELSLIIVFAIEIILIFIFLKKRNSWILNFIITYIIIIFFINLINFFYIQKNHYNVESSKAFSEELYFTNNEVKNILSNKNNQNIYYIIVDGVISLQNFNDNFKEIDIDKIIFDFKKMNFTYIDGVNSSYNNTVLTLSQILNLNYFLGESGNAYVNHQTFPTTMSKFSKSPLGKTLEKINYDYYWVGNAGENCVYYNFLMCMPNQKKIIKSLIPYIRNLINTNYALVHYLKKTPVIDFNDKVFFILKAEHSGNKIRYLENDAIKKFIKLSSILKKNKKNYFIFIHSKIHYIAENYGVGGVVYNEDCSMGFVTEKMINESSTGYALEAVGFIPKEFLEKSYSCMLKRVSEFMEFINIFDPNAMIIIQADHGLFQENLEYYFTNNQIKNILNGDNKNFYKIQDSSIFTLVKVSKKCDHYLSNQIDNINAIRLLLSCATDQKVKLLETKSFIEIDKLFGTLNRKLFLLDENRAEP